MEPKDVGPILIVVAVAVIIIVRQLLSHQRQMTALLHQVHQQKPVDESQQLQSEMQDLKQLVHRQTIALDELTNRLPITSKNDAVKDRLAEQR